MTVWQFNSSDGNGRAPELKSVDRLSGNVVAEFADGTVSVFEPAFLYQFKEKRIPVFHDDDDSAG